MKRGVRRIFCSVLALVITFSSASCAQAPKTQSSSSASSLSMDSGSSEGFAFDSTSSESARLSFDASVSSITSNDDANENIEIIFPSLFAMGADVEDIRKDAMKQGFSDVFLNDDGSLTYVIPRNQHETLLQEAKKESVDGLLAYKEGEESPYIKDVTPNDDLTKIKLTVDKAEYASSLGETSLVNMYFVCYFYQLLDGKPDPKVEFTLTDSSTGEVFDTVNYPE
ncbi:hypothetical protein [Ligaoa zhengdingensis]|uniref:hypothetical protein n=1 Tax=Ligaoa zhengdingensis TaxID=2763658 RepID=UPI0031BB6A1B